MDSLRKHALELSRGLSATSSNIEKVSRETDSETAAWAFTQWSLRELARPKFALAEEMLFAREALEQATSEQIAAFHASKFPNGVLVADLTTGIGGDLIALALRGPVRGFELDAERAEMARWNLQTHGVAASIQVESALDVPWDFEYAFADPARRVEGKRTLDPNAFEPNPVELSRRMGELRLAGIKLSPLLSDTFLHGLGARVEFVSFRSECREATVWLGSEVQDGRFAVQLESGAVLEPSGPANVVESPADFVFEADPAAIRAHCLGTLAAFHSLSALGDSNGYLTGSAEVSSPWLTAYRVIYHGKGDLKTTGVALQTLGAGTPVVKSRAKGVDVQKLAQSLRQEGSRQLIVGVYPVGRSLRHVILGRL